MKANFWHKDFVWDGTSFSSDQDIIVFVEKNYPELNVFFKEWLSDSGKILIKTSGSTGVPKKIALSREHMINSARATAKFFNLEAGSKVLLCLPLGFIAGRMMLVRSMVMGWQLDVIESSSKLMIPKNITYDFSAMVPLQLYNSLDELKKIKTLIVGGGEVSEAIVNQIDSLKTKIYATYGMTETITHIALSPLNKAAGRKGSETVFEALPGISLSADNRQCLVIDAPHISSDIVVTNDIVALEPEDSFKWLGRNDNVINSGGIKLIPELIESRYKKLIEHDYFVVGIPDHRLGEKLVLLIEGKETALMLGKIDEFHKNLNDAIPKYEIPKEIFFINTFIRTQTGKINRSQSLQLL
ncbi:MAG: AMP-binding protein [Flavobacteriales bacterium]|nr:AMP-binding protein [Flavobacteriales bacterium]